MKRQDWLAQRPNKVSEEDVEKLGRLQCTQREAAAFFGIRHHEFTEALTTPKIRAAWERGQQMGLVSLRRRQMRLSVSSASMAIFLGKNLLGQRDVMTVEGDEDGGDIDASKLTQAQRDALRTALGADKPQQITDRARPRRR